MAEEQASNSGVHLSSIGSVPQNRHHQRLQSDRALHSNDENMMDTDKFEYYLEHLWKNITEEKRSSCTCLDSLWFSMYNRAVTKEKVLRWIKRKKIFKRKYVFIPIVCWGHWSLLILCNFGENRQPDTEKPCMLLLDSLRQADPKRLEPDIRRFRSREMVWIVVSLFSTTYIYLPKMPLQFSLWMAIHIFSRKTGLVEMILKASGRKSILLNLVKK